MGKVLFDQLRAWSRVAIAITDSVERLNLRKIGIDLPELGPQAFYVAIDGSIVHVDGFAVGGVHQLIARFYMSRSLRE